jgi:simple sugar transport system ATP-binding protein
MEVADRAMVMRLGKHVADRNIADTSIEELSFLMVGRHLVETDIPEISPGKDILRITDLCLTRDGAVPILDHISIHVNAGEIVGIAGVSVTDSPIW